MPRESLNRAVGNPINKKLVPKLNLSLSFPIRLEDIGPDRQNTRFHLSYAISFSIIAYVSLVLFFGAVDEPLFYATAFACVFLIRRSISDGSALARWVIPPLCWSIALVPLSQSIPLQICLGVCIVSLIYTVSLFRRHYKSVTLRTGWARLKRPKVRSTWSVPAFFDAIDSYLNYGRHGIYAPGMKRSAAGARWWRILVLTVTLLFLAFSFSSTAFYLCPVNGRLSQDDLFLLITLLFIAHITPLFLMMLSAFLLSYFMLGRCYAVKLSESDPERFAESFPALCKELKRMRERKRNPLDVIYRGNFVADNSPIIPPMLTNMIHQIFVGASGSGKTAAMLNLVEQFMSRGDTSVVILDLKAFSFELYQSLVAVREQARTKFRLWHFTDAVGKSSHLFSLMDQAFWSQISPLQRSDLEQSAVGGSASRRYGESWFADASLAGLLYMQSKHPNVVNFAEQAELLAYEMQGKAMPEAIRKDGRQTQLILERLALTDSINRREHYSKEVIENQVDLSRVFREPTAIYAGLNTSLSPVAAPEVARLLFSSLLMAGNTLTEPERKMNVIFIIDEIQTMISSVSAVERALQQARALGVSLLFSNQLFADYVQKDSDLTSTMLGNTAIQSFYGIRDPLGIKTLESISGTNLEHMTTAGIASGPNGDTQTVSTCEQLVNRLQANEILAASSEPDQFIIRICGNTPTSCYDSLPFVARCPFHLTKDEYTRRQEQPWPAPTPDTLVNGEAPEPPEPEPPAATTVPPAPKPPVLTIEGLSDELTPKKGRG